MTTNYRCVLTWFCILLRNFLLGTNNDSFDVDDEVGDGDEHDSSIGRLRTYSDSHFATCVRENIVTISARF
jgi:hypothetical protein